MSLTKGKQAKAQPKKKIDKLTPEQEALLSEYHARWLAVGTAPAPADRPRAEAAITKMYAAIDKQPPTFLWFDSPASAILPREKLPVGGGSTDNHAAMAERDRIGLQINIRDFFGGQQECNYVAYFLFGAELGVEYQPREAEQLDWWAEIAQSCGWWAPYEDVCVMTDRPERCQMELANAARKTYRLHADDGPALRYRDGWSIYAWHGVTVPAQVIEAPETLTANDITTARNTEVRRAMIERIGGERYCALMGAVELHTDDFGTLYRAPVPGDEEPVVMVKVVNSTPEPDGSYKDYWLRVPPTMTTAQEAVAWTFALPSETYQPIIQT